MLMDLESFQAFVAFNFQATGLMLSVNKRGHKASPWGRPLLNLIWSYVSTPYFVLSTAYSIANSVGIPLFLSIPGTTEALTPVSQPLMINRIVRLAHIDAAQTPLRLS